ncbi:MAG: hypothetical protein ACK5MZ_01625 [Aestuariibaculum sp.]
MEMIFDTYPNKLFMNKYLMFFFVSTLAIACIPVRFAPNIDDYKIVSAKKFKRNLPKRNTFVFEDPKNANEFYSYINTKYELNHIDVEWNVPFTINNTEYYFSFYEVERVDETINILPIATDAILEKNNIDPVLENIYTTRKGNWYIAIVVSNSEMKDCLKTGNPDYEAILQYLKDIKYEYLNTTNYIEALFKKQN